MQAKRQQRRHDEEDLEADGTVERAEDCGKSEDVDWNHCEAGEFVPGVKAIPDVERVVTVVGKKIRMNEGVELHDDGDDASENKNAKQALRVTEDSVGLKKLRNPKRATEDEDENAEVEKLRNVD